MRGHSARMRAILYLGWIWSSYSLAFLARGLVWPSPKLNWHLVFGTWNQAILISSWSVDRFWVIVPHITICVDSSSLRASSLLRPSSYIFICSPYLTINLSNLFSIIDFWYPITRDKSAVCLPPPHLSRGQRAHGITTTYSSLFDRIDGWHVYCICITFYRRSMCSMTMQVFTHSRNGVSVLTYHAPIYCTAYGFHV